MDDSSTRFFFLREDKQSDAVAACWDGDGLTAEQIGDRKKLKYNATYMLRSNFCFSLKII